MGVHSLWDIVSPTAKPVRLESLSERKMAVDASIWIYQFLKAMRNNEGDALKHAHILGFFRRICKLLYYGIKPVFIFDGGVPTLKLNTIRERKERRQGKRDSANATARRLLARQIHQVQKSGPKTAQQNTVASMEQSEGQFYPHDEYHLPDIRGFRYDSNDSRINDIDEYKTLEEHIDELDGIDLDAINPASKEFDELPKSTQYLILSALRLKSRLRLGYTKEQLEDIFPDSMDFSRFQIDMVKRRNFFTQKLMQVTGMHDGGASRFDGKVENRISGDREKKYTLLKTDGGWALSLVGNDGSESKKAINLEDDDGDDVEWEEVDVKPKPKLNVVDYSINASILPRLTSEKTEGGSQSFFDRRPDLVSTTSHILDETDESEDDYERVIKETKAIEEYKNSKTQNSSSVALIRSRSSSVSEASDKGTNIVHNQESGDVVQHCLSKPNETVASNMKNHINHFLTSGTHKESVGDELTVEASANGLSSENLVEKYVRRKSIPQFNDKEKKAQLDTIVKKIPGLPFSLSVKGKAFEDHSTEATPSSFSSDALKSKPVQEVPAWFQSQEEFNPHRYQGFIPDDLVGASTGNELRGLVTGEAAREMVEGRARNNDPGLMEIEEESFSKDNNLINRNKGYRVVAEDLCDSTSSDDENPREQLPILDYDFYEDEEQQLTEQLEKEREDYNSFKRTLNPNLVDRMFMDDEISEQQKKDKRDAAEVTIDMIREIQDLLSRFGIPYITAPMEAEAQCATLLKAKLVDGIITDDSDVFLFGGTHIYKNMFQEKNYVEFYSLDILEQKMGLDRQKLIQLAQMLGSDYTPGLKGVGPVMGIEILAEFGDLQAFKQWYNEGQFDKQKLEGETAFKKQLRRRLVSNDIILDEAFPSTSVRDAYMNPTVDFDETKFVWGSPDLDKLRNFLRQTIGWDKAKSDEVLVPLIRDLNKKKKVGVQKHINEFFPVQYLQQDKNLKMGKRIESATMKLKKRRTK